MFASPKENDSFFSIPFTTQFFSFCNQIENLSYEIKSINNLENVDTKLSIGIENKLNSKTELTFQFFPKN